MRRPFLISIIGIGITFSSCVISNLDNAFDQNTPLGMMVWLSLESSGSSTGGTESVTPSLWNQQAYLKASNPEIFDQFGYSASIDGDTIVVGARGEASNQTTISSIGSFPTAAGDDDSESQSGAAYVFTRSGNEWAQQAYLKAPNAETHNDFGWAVSIDGDTIVVAARWEDSIQTTVSNSGSLPTAAGDDDSEADAGALYVFVRSGTTWSQQAYLKASNSDLNDNLGYSVDIDGDTIVAGVLDDSNQSTVSNTGSLPTAGGPNELEFNAGAAYVFVRSGTTWSQQAFLKAPNPETNDALGFSVAISGDTIVAGASGEQSNQTSVSHSGSLPTAAGDDDSASSSGAAYVFARSGSNWSQQAYLKAPNSEASDSFGIAVDISGDTIVVGASFEDSKQTTISDNNSLPTPASDDDSAGNAGAAYVFIRSGTTWSQQAYLKAPNAEAGDGFGWAVAIGSDTVVVGARQEDSASTAIFDKDSAALPTPEDDDDSAANAGAAYVFIRSGTTWIQKAYLKAPNAETLDEFGSAVAINGSTIVATAYSEDSNIGSVSNNNALPTPTTDDDSTALSGAAYVFELQ